MAEFNFDNLSPEEKEQLAREAFKSKEKEFAKRAKEEQEAHYKQLVDETIEKAVESVGELNIKMTVAKKQIFNDFDTVIALKNELYTGQKWLKTDRVTNTFTNQEGNKRVTVGYHTNDNYLDTYTEGVKLVEEYISSLATDENGQKLADMVKVQSAGLPAIHLNKGSSPSNADHHTRMLVSFLAMCALLSIPSMVLEPTINLCESGPTVLYKVSVTVTSSVTSFFSTSL